MNSEQLFLLESLYLFYMFFIFKTTYSFNSAIYDEETQELGSLFIHNTNKYENKICMFGKIMAIVAIILAYIRLSKNNTTFNIIFDVICVLLCFVMNLNALIYIIPLILVEIYIISKYN